MKFIHPMLWAFIHCSEHGEGVIHMLFPRIYNIAFNINSSKMEAACVRRQEGGGVDQRFCSSVLQATQLSLKQGPKILFKQDLKNPI